MKDATKQPLEAGYLAACRQTAAVTDFMRRELHLPLTPTVEITTQQTALAPSVSVVCHACGQAEHTEGCDAVNRRRQRSEPDAN